MRSRSALYGAWRRGHEDPDVWRHGSEMPETWYVILFGPIARQRTLVRDGHLPTGDFLPPMALSAGCNPYARIGVVQCVEG